MGLEDTSMQGDPSLEQGLVSAPHKVLRALGLRFPSTASLLLQALVSRC